MRRTWGLLSFNFIKEAIIMEEQKKRGRGRPRGREPKDRRVEVRLSENDIKLLNRVSIEEDIPVSQVIRKAVRLYGNTWNRDLYF